MREIKFRYRIKYGDEVRTDIVLLSELENKIFDFTSEDVLSRDEYTGLKDKNGKEIYEGDILEDDTWTVLRVVSWLDGCFIAEPGLNNPELGSSANDGVVTDVSVIGNIYENPNVI